MDCGNAGWRQRWPAGGSPMVVVAVERKGEDALDGGGEKWVGKKIQAGSFVFKTYSLSELDSS